MKYRAEIDGLRALAVLPVILFHAGFETFGGGFVGVDVFFVISGYLITTIILVDLEQGQFSLLTFYERRIRRIVPALFLVMLACIPFAWFWLLPGDMKDFSQSLVAVSVFASNILFWQESGYFDTAADLKPLLHTWSLGVEEQFYVLYPLLLMCLWYLGKRWFAAVLLGLFFVSLTAAQWASNAMPSAGFYLLPTRGWELLLGAFAALYLARADRAGLSARLSELAGCLGVILILFAVFVFSDNTPFPGLYALVPTVGTLLVILFASQQTVVGQLLGSRMLVGIGLISCSAYLWHQPLFAFARHRSLTEPGHLLFALLSVAALALAYLSWRFVELPFRNRANLSRKQVFLWAALGSGFVISVGLLGHLTQGVFIERPRVTEAMAIESRLVPSRGLSSDCGIVYNESENCQTHDDPDVLVWGDSYAMHLVPGLIASNPDTKLVQKTVSACGPILDIAPRFDWGGPSWSEQCIATNDKVFEFLKASPGIKYVVLSSLLRQYISDDSTVLTRDGAIVPGEQITLESMISTINQIKALGKIPVVFSVTPQNGENIGLCLKKAMLFDADRKQCHVSAADSHVFQADVWKVLEKVEEITPVVWLTEGLCSTDSCKTFAGDILIYRDTGHLSREGGAYLGREMDFYGRLVQASQPPPG